jgi:hypothetical protein
MLLKVSINLKGCQNRGIIPGNNFHISAEWPVQYLKINVLAFRRGLPIPKQKKGLSFE